MGAVGEIFSNPQSGAAKRLVYPGGERTEKFSGKRLVRIVFDGKSSFEPVIANMILACQAPVNIMFANTQDIEGIAVGQMVIQLPEDENQAERLMNYLRNHAVQAEEVEEIG